MANSKYEYVRSFELEDRILPQTYIVVRVDGRKFHQFSKYYDFAKPNDIKALTVMNRAAQGVMQDVQDIMLAYGDSDEYSFAFLRDTELFDRRSAKLVSTVVSTFTAHYIFNWMIEFNGAPSGTEANSAKAKPLEAGHLPSFDGRAVTYPNFSLLKDYFCWRQVDCHINNLYNTTFWALVLQGNMTPDEAETRLQGTVSADKNEILFSEFQINYNNEPEMYKKGTVIKWKGTVNSAPPKNLSKRQLDRRRKALSKSEIQLLHIDIIRNAELWAELYDINEKPLD